MARTVSYIVDDAQEGERFDVVLANAGLYASRSRAARALDEGRVFSNGALVAKKQRASAGDLLICELDEDAHAQGIAGEPIDLDIRFEDDDLIVLSKPAGMLTHPSADHQSGTLVNALIHRYGCDGLCNVQGEDDRPGIVHRLDGDTSGLMLAAKTDEAGQALMDAIALRDVDRRYLALVHGVIASDTGMIDAPIARHPKIRAQMGVFDTPSSREAMTTFTTLARFAPESFDNGYTLVECKLYTGRTHQIRVHMQYIAHPIVGDRTYVAHAPKRPAASLGLERQFLHSYRLAFDHPMTGERLEFSDGLPDDLAKALESLQHRCEYMKQSFDLGALSNEKEGER